MSWYQDQKRCVEAARRVLKQSRIVAPPVNVEAIVRILGAEIIDQELDSRDLCGLLLRDAERTIISVNRNQGRTRRRFTIAHEIGHLVLHKGKPVFLDKLILVNARIPRSGEGDAIEEREANWFAAELLMPAEMVDSVVADRVKRGKIDNVEEFIKSVAKSFDVSLEAMRYRLLNLGAISLSLED